jgi:hypothetical protein
MGMTGTPLLCFPFPITGLAGFLRNFRQSLVALVESLAKSLARDMVFVGVVILVGALELSHANGSRRKDRGYPENVREIGSRMFLLQSSNASLEEDLMLSKKEDLVRIEDCYRMVFLGRRKLLVRTVEWYLCKASWKNIY